MDARFCEIERMNENCGDWMRGGIMIELTFDATRTNECGEARFGQVQEEENWGGDLKKYR